MNLTPWALAVSTSSTIKKILRKPKRFDPKTEVRRLARKHVGTVPSPKIIVPKNLRKKPKHKKPIEAEDA